VLVMSSADSDKETAVSTGTSSRRKHADRSYW